MFKQWVRILASLVAAATLSAGAAAQTFTEGADAGQTLATAQAVPAGTTTIHGTLGTAGDVDLYSFTVSTAGIVTIRAWGNEEQGNCRVIDANLILFNGAGNPLWGDDDGYAGTVCLGSQIVLNLAAGTYYLAFGNDNIEAFYTTTSDGFLCGNDVGDCSTSTGVLDHFISNGDAPTGPYTITFALPAGGGGTGPSSVAAVPGPTGWLLLPLLAVVGLAGARRFRRRA